MMRPDVIVSLRTSQKEKVAVIELCWADPMLGEPCYPDRTKAVFFEEVDQFLTVTGHS